MKSTQRARVKRRSASAPSSRRRPFSSALFFPAGSGGFTLLELLLVLMVIALAGVMIFPDLNPALSRTRDEAALRRTVGTLDDFRRRAVSGGRTLTLSHGKTGRSLLVSVAGKEGDEELEEPLPEGVEAVSLEPEKCRYFPQGHSSGPDSHRQDGKREARTHRSGILYGAGPRHR